MEGLEMSDVMNHEMMMEEAERRLDILISMGMPEGLKEQFRNGTVYLADSLLSARKEYEALYDPQMDMVRLPREPRFDDRLREISEQIGGVVYLALDYYHIVFGRMVSFFYVIPDSGEWDLCREDLKEGYPVTYVYNYDENYGEFGEIQFRIDDGGRMHRIR